MNNSEYAFLTDCSVLFSLLPIFSLCFSPPCLSDLGEVKVVFQNEVMKIEGEVLVQPQFFQVKYFFLVTACFSKPPLMRQALGPGALGKPRGSGWRGRWERGSGWGTHVNPGLFHFNV